MTKILENKPFNLNKKQLQWVKDTFAKLDTKAKIGQLFILVAGMDPKEDVENIIEKYQPGGFMYRPLPKVEIFKMHSLIQNKSKIPAFLAANTEAGGDGLCVEGTHVGSNMQVAATNDSNYGYLQGKIAGKELRAVGGNLSFAPVVDINLNWRNPITNLRAYSDDTEKVKAFAVQNVIGTQEQGAAVSVKHFPGDGIDDRDHHIATSMNHLSLKAWDQSYGKIYRACFEVGALTTMVGHFFAPQLVKDLKGPKEDIYHPTSWNKTILQSLLRNHLNFNGLVLTDATLMTGMVKYSIPRHKMVPLAIEAGADVFLFVRNLKEDFDAMYRGYKDGLLSEKRLNEAVIRILGTKAKLNLFDDLHLNNNNLNLIGSSEHQKIAHQVASKSITLVKNKQNLFPLKNIKSVLLITFLKPGFLEKPGTSPLALKLVTEQFKKANINVEVKDYMTLSPFQGIIDAKVAIEDLKSKYDAIFYFSDQQPTSNKSSLLIEWKAFVGQDAPSLISEIPSAWISLGSPYHLFDAPQMPNFINAYHNNKDTIEALFNKLLGKEEFVGISPVKDKITYIYYQN